MLAPRLLLEGLLDLLAPPRCPGCDEVLIQDESGFCGGCEPLIDPAPPGVLPPASGASMHLFAGPLADAIRRVKYEGRTDLAGPLAALVEAVAPRYGGRVDGVLPVPLHRRRLAERGFNQSVILAKPLARALGVPLLVGRLHRLRPTRPQVGLDAEARRDNVRGAFRVVGALPERLLLFDDVRTTGATLSEAGQALREAGADVSSLTLARAPSP